MHSRPIDGSGFSRTKNRVRTSRGPLGSARPRGLRAELYFLFTRERDRMREKDGAGDNYQGLVSRARGRPEIYIKTNRFHDFALCHGYRANKPRTSF